MSKSKKNAAMKELNQSETRATRGTPDRLPQGSQHHQQHQHHPKSRDPIGRTRGSRASIERLFGPGGKVLEDDPNEGGSARSVTIQEPTITRVEMPDGEDNVKSAESAVVRKTVNTTISIQAGTATTSQREDEEKEFADEAKRLMEELTASNKETNVNVNRPRPTRMLSSGEIFDAITDGSAFTFSYLFDILRTSLTLLKHPFSVLLSLFILALVIGRISKTLQVAFAPLCILPGISRSYLCSTSSGYPGSSRGGIVPDFSKLGEIQTQTFDTLLVEALGGNSVALDIKKVEMAASDLSTLVRVSDLKGKDRLAALLDEFVTDGKKTGRRLQKLSSKAVGAVNQIITINDYALRTIRGEAKKAQSWYNPTNLLSGKRTADAEQAVNKVFLTAMDVSSEELRKLVIEAEASLADVYGLEESLRNIHSLVISENKDIKVAKEEVLRLLWTKLGGNKDALRGFNDNLELLRNVGAYHDKAKAHVVAALHTLHEMSEDMEGLRERVSAPQLTDGKIPLEVHMKSIEGCLGKLNEGRLLAKRKGDEAVRMIRDSD